MQYEIFIIANQRYKCNSQTTFKVLKASDLLAWTNSIVIKVYKAIISIL